MKDTHPEIEERFFKMVMEKSGEERLKMGFEMNVMARRLATASILQNTPQFSEEDVKLAIFDRFYGSDLPSEVKQKVIEKIKR